MIVKFYCNCFDVFVKFTYWFNFYVNISTGSGVASVLVLAIIWRLGKVRDTKFDTDITNEMLLNAKCYKVRGFTVSELLREANRGE